MEKMEYLRSQGYTYLIHITTKSNIELLYKKYQSNLDQKIGTLYERYLEKVQADGVFASTDINFDERYRIHNACEFPGLFFVLSNHSMEELKEKYEHHQHFVCLVFPLELMLQQNWHMNLTDQNGLISYDTFFPDTLTSIPSHKELDEYYSSLRCGWPGNEVIFHDGIPLSNCLSIIGKETNEIMIHHQLRLDLHKKPNYVFYSDRRYDGTPIHYFHHEHRHENTTTDAFYIEFIRNHLPDSYKYLCDHVSKKVELELKIYSTKIDDYDLFTYLSITR